MVAPADRLASMRWPQLSTVVQGRTFETGIPMETAADRFLRALQPFLAVAFAVLAIAFVEPMGLTGAGLVRLLLVLGCLVLMLTVPVPDRLVSADARLVIATVAGVLAGALMGLAGQGWGGTFAYMVAVHSGARFAPLVATRVVGLCALVGCVATALWNTDPNYPWWANLVVLAVLIPSMGRRARTLTLAAANEVVVQTRRAAASEAEMRALAERAAIARDIHDVLAHTLSGVNMQLSLADALLESGQEAKGRVAVAVARRLVVDGLDEARSAVSTLRGDTIDAAAAVSALTTGPHEVAQILGTPYPLPSRAAHALVRAAQESLTNARRHAPGAPVRMTLEYAADVTRLVVRNGTTEQPSTGGGSGLGLVGMRERAASIGATLEVGPLAATDPDLPRGWSVSLSVPRHTGEETP